MKTFLPPCVLILLFLLSGCSTLHEKMNPAGGPSFSTSNQTGFLQAEMIPVPSESKPLVKFIKGKPISDVEGALRALAGRGTENSALGLHARISSLMLREVNVRTIAELLTDICGYNVIATTAVGNKPVSIFLQNITLREALNAICRLNNLWYREGQGIITLMTREEYVQDIEARQSDQTRAFYIRYTNAADMAKLIKSSMGDEVHLSVIDDEKIYGHIDPEEKATVDQEAQSAQSLALRKKQGEDTENLPLPLQTESTSPSGKSKPTLAMLTVFKRNNCIVARSLDGGLLNEMERIIEALDTPTSQVLLEIKILQLTLGDGFESFFDVDWQAATGAGITGDYATTMGLGGTAPLAASSLNFFFDSEKLAARVEFFEKNGRAEIISTPFLMTANNSKVEFFVGEETPLREDVTTETVPIGDQGDTRTTFHVDITREELGTDIEMTTFINADSTVTLEFDAEISSPILNYSTVTVVNDKNGKTLEFPLDGKSKSEIKSILSARSGQTIAIGGIIKETLDYRHNKVPVLGDIPALGLLFREINNSKKKTETVILLTPHVIMHPAQAEQVAQEFLHRKSSHEQVTKDKTNILEDNPPHTKSAPAACPPDIQHRQKTKVTP